MNISMAFIMLQSILLPFMTFRDWFRVPLLPLPIDEMEKNSTKMGRFVDSVFFFFLIFVPLCLTWYYQPDYPKWVLITIVSFYGLLSFGAVISWWISYIFKKALEEYKDILPERTNAIVQNTLHAFLSVLIWICFGISMYLLMYT